MSVVIKFSVSDEDYQQLEALAMEQGVTVQDIVRQKLFNTTTIFTPVEAVKRALSTLKSGDKFTLPSLYGEDWTLQRGPAGAFGKQFFNYVRDEVPDKIKFDSMVNCQRNAQYEIL